MTAATARSTVTVLRDRRKQPRKGTIWQCELQTPSGVVACRVLNLSARGAKLEIDDGAVTPGQNVTLVLEPLGEFLGTIAWQREGKAGLHINECRTTRGEIALPRSLAGEAATGD